MPWESRKLNQSLAGERVGAERKASEERGGITTASLGRASHLGKKASGREMQAEKKADC